MGARFAVDLHLHTTCSDGVLAPAQLFALVRDAGLEYFSVTDHDTMASYPMPADLAERCIRGIEVDSELHGRTVHILAYGIEANSPLVKTLDRQRADRLERMKFIVAKLQNLGYAIELQHVLDQAGSAASLGRPHLARALVAAGIVADVREAFDKFLADDGPAFVPLKRLSAGHIVELIHASGGVAVVAHPRRLRAEGDLAELVAAGVDGIEVAHPTASLTQQAEYVAFAAEHGLLATGGTDFHAPSEAVGALGVAFERDAIDRLLDAIAARRSTAPAAS